MLEHHAVIRGEGEEIIIFLPGTGWSGDFGAPIAESLREGFVTHMIDLPGIGRSKGLQGVIKLQDTADWLDKYIEQNRLKKVNIIGHSLGGIIGLAYTYHYPHKVNRLILLDIGYSKIERFPVQMMGSVGYFIPIISILHRIFGEKALGKENESKQDTQERTKSEAEIQKVIKDLGIDDSPFIRKAIQNHQETTIEGISLLLAGYRSNLPKIVKKLKIPCLILYGNRGNGSKKNQMKVIKMVNKLKKTGITLEELNGGHYAHVSDTKAKKLIYEFLATVN